ncbi:hypothetical protein BDV06DRAFT_217227 [Aspergillus oleicola]
MSLIKEGLTKYRSRISKFLSSFSQVASVERVNFPVAEEPDYYTAGGFHPISLGNSFHNGQYTILRKLGYGQYSTVWLASDSKRQRYVALKVLRADCYGGHHDIVEREILSKILEVSRRSSHQGRNYVSHLLGQFTHTGPNGDHVCFAFDVLGHHLGFQSAKYEDGKLPVKAVKVITRQLLLALDFLHRECDLKPTNILLGLENPCSTITRYLAEVPARTDSQRGVTTPLREAPEVTIGAPWDIGVDIWSLGCLIMELVQGIVLFSGEASSKGTWTAEDDHLAKIIEVVGQFPLHFIEKGSRAAHFFDRQGNLLRIPNLKPTCLERLINGATNPFLKPVDMPEAEVPIFVDFIKGMLEVDPGSRKSAAELLQHEWIRS